LGSTGAVSNVAAGAAGAANATAAGAAEGAAAAANAIESTKPDDAPVADEGGEGTRAQPTAWGPWVRAAVEGDSLRMHDGEGSAFRWEHCMDIEVDVLPVYMYPPHAQLRVLRAEDEARAPSRALREAWHFLGLRDSPNLDDGALDTALGATLGTAPLAPSRGDEGERSALKTALETGALAALAAFYREHSAELVQLMDGDERFAWGAAA
jgi:hypothetical protein